MEHGVKYIVTDAKDSGEFLTGDHIWLLENGDIMCKEAGGWLPKEDVEESLKKIDYRIDWEYYEHSRQKLVKQIQEIDEIINQKPV